MSSLPLFEKLDNVVRGYPDNMSCVDMPIVEFYERSLMNMTWKAFGKYGARFRLSNEDLEVATGEMNAWTNEMRTSLSELLSERGRTWIECDYANMRQHLGHLHVAPRGQDDYSDKKNHWGYQLIKPTKPEDMPANIAMGIMVTEPQVAEFRIIHDAGEPEVTVTPYLAKFDASQDQPFQLVGCELGELIMKHRLGENKMDVINVATAALQRDFVYMTAMLKSLPR